MRKILEIYELLNGYVVVDISDQRPVSIASETIKAALDDVEAALHLQVEREEEGAAQAGV